MKKLNNKGFAISSILYSMLILIVTLMFLVLGIMSSRRNTLNKAYQSVRDNINDRDYSYNTEIPSTCTTGTAKVFSYTGSVQTVTLAPGTYKLEVWGAQGGTYLNSTTQLNYGGYSTGEIKLTETTTLYIYVGGRGNNGGRTTNTATKGGWNGGGGIVATSSTSDSHSGGGATDISTVNSDVTLDSYQRYIRSAASYNSRLIVAGGGGAPSYGSAWAVATATTAGTFGGSTGTRAGTASAAGTISSSTTSTIGGFGYGSSSLTATGDDQSAGGGGWYGGGTNGDSYGGGGSNYVLTSGSYRPSGYLFGAGHKYEMTAVSMIAGNVAMPTHNGTGTMSGNSGNGYAKITPIICDESDPDPIPKEFSYVGAVQTYTIQKTGNYRLEVWGAQGGSFSATYEGGRGGYSAGTVKLTKDTVLYIYTGGQGSSTAGGNILNGGFNGGGYAYGLGTGGGGASDIRIGTDTLYHRVIVAGGGGGASSGSTTLAGYGGGITGGSTSRRGSASGGSSTAAGVTTPSNTSYNQYSAAGFGFGGNITNGTGAGGGGGGGGWYGGAAGPNDYPSYNDNDDTAGAGGSGYVYTSTSAVPSGYSLTSTYQLNSISIIGGNQTVPTHSGTGTMTGNSGNGFVKITYIP